MRIHRRLSALLFLLARHRHSAAELAACLGTSLRTVYRDIERLRERGYAVDAISGPGGGFLLAEGCAPAPVELGLDEVREILFALHGSNDLEYDLEERLLGALPAVHSAELRAALAKATVPDLSIHTTKKDRRRALRVYSRALARGNLFSFDDPARPWRRRRRLVWPIGLVCRPEGWSLVLEAAHDPKRHRWEQPLHRVVRPKRYNRRRPAPPRRLTLGPDTTAANRVLPPRAQPPQSRRTESAPDPRTTTSTRVGD